MGRGGGGLQLSASCALSTMISQCCTFRRLRCWIQFFCLECRWMQSVVCIYKMKAIAQNPTNWRIMFDFVLDLFIFRYVFLLGTARPLFFSICLHHGNVARREGHRRTSCKPNCPRWNQSSLVGSIINYMGSCVIMSLYDYFCALVFSATGEV